MPGKLEASLFRMLIRQHARGLPKGTSEVIPSFDSRAWLDKRGSPTLTDIDSDPPSLGPFTGVRQLSTPQLIGEVRRRFREAGGSVEQAVEAIRALDEQRYLRENQDCHTTKEAGLGLNIRICSMTEPVGAGEILEYYDEDDDEDGKQYWTYRVLIKNCSETETVRVVSRHWKIYADDELVLEVPPSPGVIGMKPELPPGATFMYYSGTDVAAGRKGFMTGSLGVVVVGKNGAMSETIHATVPRMEFS